jgi:glutamate--cysteine ligase
VSEIRSYDDLLAPFHAAIRPGRHVGVEMEKIGLVGDGKPLPYSADAGKPSILSVFAELQKTHGWKPYREKEDGPIIALEREGASVTLEPGAQLELSGAPHDDIHAVAEELDEHMDELRPVSKRLGITWLGLGFHPFAKRADLPWVPKARYAIMREYLPTRGAHALDMMQRTCTVQANFDFASEARAMLKLRVGLKLAPITTALFANSPIVEGHRFEGPSMRAKVWLAVDPDRSGLVPVVWREAATFRDYVEWALDVPMFLFKRGDEIIANTGQTFRSFWKEGFQGHKATAADWQLHLNTLFPDVRLKKTIEIRGADSQPLDTAPALAAIYAGIFYDDRALDAARSLVEPWTHAEVDAARSRVFKEGLAVPLAGKRLAVWAEQLLDISRGGLSRRAKKDTTGRDETVYLDPIVRLASLGKSPASRLDGVADEPSAIRKAVLERCAL